MTPYWQVPATNLYLGIPVRYHQRIPSTIFSIRPAGSLGHGFRACGVRPCRLTTAGTNTSSAGYQRHGSGAFFAVSPLGNVATLMLADAGAIKQVGAQTNVFRKPMEIYQ